MPEKEPARSTGALDSKYSTLHNSAETRARRLARPADSKKLGAGLECTSTEPIVRPSGTKAV